MILYYHLFLNLDYRLAFNIISKFDYGISLNYFFGKKFDLKFKLED